MGGCCVTPVYDRDAASHGNFNTAVFTPTTGAPEITFVVRRTGQGNIRMYVRADADAAGEQFSADVEIRENGPAGTIVHSPGVEAGGIQHEWDPAFRHNTNHYGDRPIEELGLAAGTYWAQLQIDTAGTNVDIADQWLRFGP